MTRAPDATRVRSHWVLQGLLYLTWASTWPVGKAALRAWTPLGLIAVRHFLAGGALLLACAWGKRAALPLLVVAAVGALQYFAYYFLSYVALVRLDSGMVALVSGAYPVFVALLATRGAAGRGPSGGEWFALAAVIAGGLLVAWSADAALLHGPAAASPGAYLAAFLGAVCLAIATQLSARVFPADASFADVGRFVGATMLVGAVVALLGSWVTGDPWLSGRLSGSAVLSVGYLSLFGSIGVFLTHTALLRSEAAWRVAAGYPLVPVFSLVLGALALGERPSLGALPGIVLLFAGLVTLTVMASRERARGG